MNRYVKRLPALLLSIILTLSLTGCGKIFDAISPSETIDYTSLPKPKSDNPAAPTGDEKAAGLSKPIIYYADAGGDMLLPRTRVINISAQEDLCRRLAEEVLNPPMSSANSVAPKDTRIRYTESGSECVTVCVLPSSVLSEKENHLLSSAISRTILENTGAAGVNLLIADRAMTLGALPMGVITETTDLTALMNEALPTAGGTYTRNAVLYLPASDKTHVLAAVRSLSISADDPALSLITALSQIKAPSNAYTLALNTETAFEKASQYASAPDGSRILHVYFTENAFSTLSSSSHTLDQAFASIALTLTSFLPATDGVSIHFPSGPVTEIRKAGETLLLEDSILRRSDAASLIGTPIQLYFVKERTHLAAETRICPLADALCVRTRLQYLIDGPVSGNLSSPLPAGLRQTDFTGIRVSDGIAHINLSGELYRLCQSCTENEEALFVYALVNTVCELDQVTGVRFYVEGDTVSTLTKSIHLESVLLKNPGLVSEK